MNCANIYSKKIMRKTPKSIWIIFLDYLLNNYYEHFQGKLESNYVEKKIDNNCAINSLKKIIVSNIDKHSLKLLISIYTQLKKLYAAIY